MDTRNPKRRLARTLAVAASLAVAAAGCASQTHHDDPTAQNVDAAALLGAVNKADGQPVTLGFITDGKSPSFDNTPAKQTAHAAVKYVNEHLGGIAGRPITLFMCVTHGTPAGNADCANQMVDRKVPVVLNDISGNGASVTRITSAGIPYVTWSATSHEGLTTEHSYSITGAKASIDGGLAEYSKKHGIKKVAILGIDVPAVTQGVHAVTIPLFKKAGISVKYTPIPPGTPDILPQVQSAMSNKPGAIAFFADPNMCAAGLKAARNLGYSGKLYIVPQCIDPATMGSVPGGYKGVIAPTVTVMKNSDHEYQLYKAVLQKYSPDTAEANFRSGIAVGGYGVVVAFTRAMNKAKLAKVEPKDIMTALSSVKHVPTPVAGGATFSCDGTAVPRFPAICSVQTQVATLDEDGNPAKYVKVNPSELFH